MSREFNFGRRLDPIWEPEIVCVISRQEVGWNRRTSERTGANYRRLCRAPLLDSRAPIANSIWLPHRKGRRASFMAGILMELPPGLLDSSFHLVRGPQKAKIGPSCILCVPRSCVAYAVHLEERDETRELLPSCVSDSYGARQVLHRNKPRLLLVTTVNIICHRLRWQVCSVSRAGAARPPRGPPSRTTWPGSVSALRLGGVGLESRGPQGKQVIRNRVHGVQFLLRATSCSLARDIFHFPLTPRSCSLSDEDPREERLARYAEDKSSCKSHAIKTRPRRRRVAL